MLERTTLVTNTTPLIALIAATGNLDILCRLYERVVVPFEVCQEMTAGGANQFGVQEFTKDMWLEKRSQSTSIPPILRNSLDLGEASVIQLALQEGIPLVAIDEAIGRRVARLAGLTLTGSLGILIRAKREGQPISLRSTIANMRDRGIWLSEHVAHAAIGMAGE